MVTSSYFHHQQLPATLTVDSSISGRLGTFLGITVETNRYLAKVSKRHSRHQEVDWCPRSIFSLPAREVAKQAIVYGGVHPSVCVRTITEKLLIRN